MMTVYILAALGAVAIIAARIKNGRIIAGTLLSAFQGIAVLYAVNIIGTLLSVHINVNWFSLLFCAFTSVPGVVMLLITDIFI